MMHWRKSTYSGGDNPNCVEAARLDARNIAVRDSKNPANGHLTVTPKALREALASYRYPEGHGNS